MRAKPRFSRAGMFFFFSRETLSVNVLPGVFFYFLRDGSSERGRRRLVKVGRHRPGGSPAGRPRETGRRHDATSTTQWTPHFYRRRDHDNNTNNSNNKKNGANNEHGPALRAASLSRTRPASIGVARYLFVIILIIIIRWKERNWIGIGFQRVVSDLDWVAPGLHHAKSLFTAFPSNRTIGSCISATARGRASCGNKEQ